MMDALKATTDLTPEDEEVRLECVRLAMAFGTGDPVATAEKLFRFIKEGPEE